MLIGYSIWVYKFDVLLHKAWKALQIDTSNKHFKGRIRNFDWNLQLDRSAGKFRQQIRPTPNKFPRKSFNSSCFPSPDLKRDIAELPNRSSVIDICVDRRRDENISPKICILHGLWRPTRERQKVFPFITLFYCRLLSLVQMAKISIISSHETSFSFVFWLESGEQKFSLIVKSITLANIDQRHLSCQCFQISMRAWKRDDTWWWVFVSLCAFPVCVSQHVTNSS